LAIILGNQRIEFRPFGDHAMYSHLHTNQNSSTSSFPGNDLHKVTDTCIKNAKIVKGIRHPDEFQGEKNSEATHA